MNIQALSSLFDGALKDVSVCLDLSDIRMSQEEFQPKRVALYSFSFGTLPQIILITRIRGNEIQFGLPDGFV